MFIHHVLKAIGSFIAVLGSVDALVFSAGMAENAPFIRERLLFQLADFGIYLDSQMNRKIFALKPAQWESLHQEKSKVGLFVVGANENEAMALEAFQVIKAEGIK
jgi:acetate kinase